MLNVRPVVEDVIVTQPVDVVQVGSTLSNVGAVTGPTILIEAAVPHFGAMSAHTVAFENVVQRSVVVPEASVHAR